MKIRNIFILTALILVVFCLGSCGDAGSNNQGVIKINFNNSGARSVVDKSTMIYDITLTSPGKETITRNGVKHSEPIRISVSEGKWNIKVGAKGDLDKGNRIVGQQKEPDGVNVTVTAGATVPQIIEMKVTGTRVFTYDQLVDDFNSLKKDGNLQDLEELDIEIISEDETDKITLETDKTKTVDAATLEAGKTVTLWSDLDVTIKRKDRLVNVDATVFTVKNGTLILGGKGTGTITIDGNKDGISNCNRALINVGENPPQNNDCILKIYDGVTLKSNTTENGGGVWVSGSTACFIMHGGTITNNKARVEGGGVFVINNGTFQMKGGVISGNTADYGGGVCVKVSGTGTFIKTRGTVNGNDDGPDSNSATPGQGAAVYDKNKANSQDSILREDDPWPRP